MARIPRQTIIWLCLLPFHLFCQPFFNKLSSEEGLSQLNNEYAFVDSRGLFWISSLAGLNRFDGHRVKTFLPDPNDSTALLGGNIQSPFFEAQNGDIWFSTWEAVHCFVRKRGTFQRFQLKNEYAEARIGYQVFWREPNGKLWLSLGQTDIFVFDPQNSTFRFVRKNLPQAVMTLPVVSKDSLLKFFLAFRASDKKLLLADPKTSESDRFFDLEKDLNDIAQKDENVVWLFGDHFLGELDLNKRHLLKPANQPNFYINTVTPLFDGKLLAAGIGGGGTRFFDKKAGVWVEKTPFDGFPDSTFGKRTYWSKVAANGDWQIHTPLEGIYFGNARKQKFRSLLPKEKIQTIAEDKKGHVWAANFSGSLFEFSEEKKLLAVHSAKPKSRDSMQLSGIRFLFFDRENRAWIGTWKGLQLKLPDQNRFRVCGGANQIFLHGFELSDGRLIFSELSGGLWEAKKSNVESSGFRLEKVQNVSSEKAYTTLFQAENGFIYACRELAGVAVFDPNNHFREVAFLPISGEINHWLEPPNSPFLWISTSNGLVRFSKKNQKAIVFGQKEGLLNNYVLATFADSSGSFWLSTHRGLARFFPEKDSFRCFSKADGLNGIEFNVFAALQKKSGEIWFGGMGGISFFEPKKMAQMERSGRPLISEILVNDQSPAGLVCRETGATDPLEMRSIRLNFDQNTISFRLALSEFGDPKAIRFLYKLVGIDKKWLPCGPSASPRYPALAAGRYELLVRGFNSDGIESLEMAWLKMVVEPPFWQTAWFKMLMLALFSTIAYAIYRYRIAHLRREFDLSQNALKNEKKALESTISALLAQMNPHFIFNSLNSINAFILKKEGDEASRYLLQFADLMRQMLDYSALKTIRLDQEITFLNDYLAIESLRMSGRLAWQIDLADDLDDFDQIIPPMILQPFVENAIWHGLAPKPDGGRILIHFKKENGGLVCSVEDNGVGLRKAADARKSRQHESKSQSITRERLALFDLQNDTFSSFDLADLIAENGSILGARATLRLGQTKKNLPT